jgi:hypothetical protein
VENFTFRPSKKYENMKEKFSDIHEKYLLNKYEKYQKQKNWKSFFFFFRLFK